MSAPATATNVRPIRTVETVSAENGLQGVLQRWFTPHAETQMVAQQAKGIFLPYPLLAILVTVGVLLISGIIAYPSSGQQPEYYLASQGRRLPRAATNLMV